MKKKVWFHWRWSNYYFSKVRDRQTYIQTDRQTDGRTRSDINSFAGYIGRTKNNYFITGCWLRANRDHSVYWHQQCECYQETCDGISVVLEELMHSITVFFINKQQLCHTIQYILYTINWLEVAHAWCGKKEPTQWNFLIFTYVIK